MIIYKTRNIKFKELIKIDNWQIKVYTISLTKDFDNLEFYSNVKVQLSNWLKLKNGFNSKHYKVGFLILHTGSEGIFSLINWWLDGYMLNTNIYLTNYDRLDAFEKVSGHGLSPCVWELEVINRERIAWTNHVLKQAPSPDLKSYLNITFNTIL